MVTDWVWNNLCFFYQVCFFSNNNINNGLGELSYFLGLFITCVTLKESQKSCSASASFSLGQSMLQLTSARIKIGIFNDIAELSENRSPLLARNTNNFWNRTEDMQITNDLNFQICIRKRKHLLWAYEFDLVYAVQLCKYWCHPF